MKKVSDLCIAYLAETSDAKTAEALIENKMKNVETREDAIEELTSDAIAGIISSEEGAKAFIEYLETDKNLTTAEKRTILEENKRLNRESFGINKSSCRTGTYFRYGKSLR